MITAEEFIREKYREEFNIKGEMYALWKYQISCEKALMWSQEYSVMKSKFNVEKALKEASKNARIRIVKSQDGSPDIIEVDKESILEAYPLDNIK